jgi:hypothetical protein
MKEYREPRSPNPRILYLVTRWRWMINVTGLPLYSRRNKHPSTLDLKQCDPWFDLITVMERNIPSPLGLRTPVIQMKFDYFIYWVPMCIGRGFRCGRDTIGLKTKISPPGGYWTPGLQFISGLWSPYIKPTANHSTSGCLDPRNG